MNRKRRVNFDGDFPQLDTLMPAVASPFRHAGNLVAAPAFALLRSERLVPRVAWSVGRLGRIVPVPGFAFLPGKRGRTAVEFSGLEEERAVPALAFACRVWGGVVPALAFSRLIAGGQKPSLASHASNAAARGPHWLAAIILEKNKLPICMLLGLLAIA